MMLSALASAQNLFVSGSTNLLSEITPIGLKSTFGFGLSLPRGLVFDTAGNLFEADQDSGNIYEFTNYGGVLSSNRVIYTTGLYEPQGLAFDSAGNLFEVDTGSHNVNTGFIHKFTPKGAESVFASGLNPTALAIDNSNNVFVADIESESIYVFAPDKTKSTFVSGLDHPFGLAFDSKGDLFETDGGSSNIYEFTKNGSVLSSNYTVFASGLSLPEGLVFDSGGNLFVASSWSGNIYEFTANGLRSTFASGLSYPNGLAFQPIPKLQAIATNGSVQITVLMPSPYYLTTVQASTNLGKWFNIYTNTPPFTFTNSTTTVFPNCFYRALLGP